MCPKHREHSLDETTLFVAGLTSPCRVNPKVCAPREIKHVVWDADDTIWDVSNGLASVCLPPFKRLSDDALEGNTSYSTAITPYVEPKGGCTIKLLPNLRSTLARLRELGVTSSIVSHNSKGSVRAPLTALELDKEFVAIEETWQEKYKPIQEISASIGVPTNQMIFVDDMVMHLMRAMEELDIMPLRMHVDIADPSGVLDYVLRGAG